MNRKSVPVIIRKLFPFLFIVIFISCNEDEIIVKQNKSDNNFIPIREATDIASLIEYGRSSNARKGDDSIFLKSIERSMQIPDQTGKTAFYIMNYEDKGFIILSADNRVEPIRAFSLTESFPMDSKILPDGLIEWLSETSEVITDIRQRGETQSASVAQSWAICPIQQLVNPNGLEKDQLIRPIEDCPGGGGGGGCENTYVTKGPLLQSKWGQGSGYNDNVRFKNCTTGTSPTGCVVTAMAQIMKYHESPTFFNWSQMPNLSGSATTSALMEFIGNAVGMNYSCTSSGADSEDAKDAFRSIFGYSNATYTDFNSSTVKQQIGRNLPIYLAGYASEKRCFLGWCSYTDGHAWVCDGYKSTRFCESGNTYLLLHMNWGWNGNSDGWFAYNNWNPNLNFQYKKRMIYNIHP